MTSHPFRSDRSPRLRQGRLLLTSALALAMSALPVSIRTDAPLLGGQSALARDGGGGNGGGDGPGGGGGQGGGAAGGHGRGGDSGAHGRDVADQARAKHSSDGRSHGGGAGGYRDATEFMDSVRSGRAFGLERRDERVAAAQERYQAALGNRGGHPGLDAGRVGAVAHQFAPEETSALIGRGWTGPAARAAGFRSHGERVRTMVELSKRLGYGARVGALQANFGTPYENDIAALQEQLAAAQAAGDDAEVARLEAELAAAVANAKPGAGPDDSWATADLDVNDDGVVDQRDLEALDQAAGTDDGADEASAS
jgi:hypothetical protein